MIPETRYACLGDLHLAYQVIGEDPPDMFSDIVGSTQLAAELGDGRWQRVLADHNRVVRRQIDRFGGHEVRVVGDGFLATFDGPARAVRCAIAIRDGVRDLGLEIRAGLHVGEIEVLPDDIAGLAVHIGARVSALAGPGEVFTSSTIGSTRDRSHAGQAPDRDRPRAPDCPRRRAGRPLRSPSRPAIAMRTWR
jgi:class 3 adenylate cyclase